MSKLGLGRLGVLPALLLLAGSGCAKRFDLMPLPLPDLSGSCAADAEGYLTVTIRNSEKSVSIATTTEVEFSGAPALVLPTQPVAGKSEVTVRFRPPLPCAQRACALTIRADAKNEVAERNESNNVWSGRCTPARPGS